MPNVKRSDVIFPVSMCPMKTTETPDCKDVRVVPRFRAVRRTDTCQVLGVVGSNYKIVLNEECIDGLDRALKEMDITSNEYVQTTEERAELYMRYNLPGISESLSTNEEICVSLILVNSYNGWTRLGVEMELLNKTTKTYYTFGQKLIKLAQRHVKSANVSRVMEVVQKLVDFFHNDVFPKFDAMTSKALSKGEGDVIIEGLDTFPEKYREMVKNEWSRSNGTVWKFYSAFTLVITRQVESVKRQRILNSLAWKTVSKLI